MFWGNGLRDFCLMARLCQVGRNAFTTTLWNLENVCNFNENTNLLLVLVHMCMAAHPPPHTHEFTLCTHTNTYVSTYVHTHTYVYTNAHVNIYTQTHTHTHTHTHTSIHQNGHEHKSQRGKEEKGKVYRKESFKKTMSSVQKNPESSGSEVCLYYILFHWSICLFLCQYHTVLMTVTWSHYWEYSQRKLIWKDTYTPMFIVALSTVARHGSNLNVHWQRNG